MYLSVYLHVCLPVCLCVSVCLSVYVCVCLSACVYLCVCLSVWVYVCLSIFLTVQTYSLAHSISFFICLILMLSGASSRRNVTTSTLRFSNFTEATPQGSPKINNKVFNFINGGYQFVFENSRYRQFSRDSSSCRCIRHFSHFE